MVSPTKDYDFSSFDHVVSFCNSTMRRVLPDNTIYVDVQPARKELYEVGLSREVCMQCFAAIKRKEKFDSLKGVYDRVLLNKLTYGQFLAALRVFEELGFIKIADRYTVEFFPEVKSELTNSKLYNRFKTIE